MSFSRYYRFGGEPQHFAAQWYGMPPAQNSRGSRELGEANFYESSAPAFTDYRPLRKSVGARNAGLIRGQRFSDTMLEAAVPVEDLAGPPIRESGPEPLDPGELPRGQFYYIDPMAQPVGEDAGMFGLSRNETRLALLAGAAGVAFLIMRKRRPKRNPARRRRRRR